MTVAILAAMVVVAIAGCTCWLHLLVAVVVVAVVVLAVVVLAKVVVRTTNNDKQVKHYTTMLAAPCLLTAAEGCR